MLFFIVESLIFSLHVAQHWRIVQVGCGNLRVSGRDDLILIILDLPHVGSNIRQHRWLDIANIYPIGCKFLVFTPAILKLVFWCWIPKIFFPKQSEWSIPRVRVSALNCSTHRFSKLPIAYIVFILHEWTVFELDLRLGAKYAPIF